jgi:glycosyltransferase involved in cell wall biosynthesis
MKKIIDVIYRNYIPLYSGYDSFFYNPPGGISFRAKRPKAFLKIAYKVYRFFSKVWFVRKIAKLAQKNVFDVKESSNQHAIYFVCMLPEYKPTVPFVVDFEHITALLNFDTGISISRAREKILTFLKMENCIAFLPWSHAAERGLIEVLGDEFETWQHKVQVVPPALKKWTPPEKSLEAEKPFRILFVGRDPIRKGLLPLAQAYRMFSAGKNDVELVIISELSKALTKEIDSLPNTKVYRPRFNRDALFENFFFKASVLVMPTLEDTYGMAFLESLSAGLPVVATQQFAMNEIVSDGKNGILLKSISHFLDKETLPKTRTETDFILSHTQQNALANEIQGVLEILYKDPNVLTKMRTQTSQQFDIGGRNSVETRNQIFKEIFTSI